MSQISVSSFIYKNIYFLIKRLFMFFPSIENSYRGVGISFGTRNDRRISDVIAAAASLFKGGQKEISFCHTLVGQWKTTRKKGKLWKPKLHPLRMKAWKETGEVEKS